jgi:flagellar basal body rod protein FlgG
MKPEGLIAAARALRYWEQRQDVVSNNLANVDTPGFKGERVFAKVLEGAVVGAGAATDFRAGSLSVTGGPLDLSLEGEGFFVVQTPRGERFTRGGSFRLDPAGRLTDAGGNPVLGESGPLTIPPGKVEIDRTGAVHVDGREVGRLRVETVPKGTELEHDAGTLFVPGAARTPVAGTARAVHQGAIEQSNVNAVDALVDLVNVQRSYAAVQSTVKVFDGVMSTISNDLGRVG